MKNENYIFSHNYTASHNNDDDDDDDYDDDGNLIN